MMLKAKWSTVIATQHLSYALVHCMQTCDMVEVVVIRKDCITPTSCACLDFIRCEER